MNRMLFGLVVSFIFLSSQVSIYGLELTNVTNVNVLDVQYQDSNLSTIITYSDGEKYYNQYISTSEFTIGTSPNFISQGNIISTQYIEETRYWEFVELTDSNGVIISQYSPKDNYQIIKEIPPMSGSPLLTKAEIIKGGPAGWSILQTYRINDSKISYLSIYQSDSTAMTSMLFSENQDIILSNPIVSEGKLLFLALYQNETLQLLKLTETGIIESIGSASMEYGTQLPYEIYYNINQEFITRLSNGTTIYGKASLPDIVTYAQIDEFSVGTEIKAEFNGNYIDIFSSQGIATDTKLANVVRFFPENNTISKYIQWSITLNDRDPLSNNPFEKTIGFYTSNGWVLALVYLSNIFETGGDYGVYKIRLYDEISSPLKIPFDIVLEPNDTVFTNNSELSIDTLSLFTLVAFVYIRRKQTKIFRFGSTS